MNILGVWGSFRCRNKTGQNAPQELLCLLCATSRSQILIENNFFRSASAGEDFNRGFRQLSMYVTDVALNRVSQITRLNLPGNHMATKTTARRGDCGAKPISLEIRNQIKSFSVASYVLMIEVFADHNVTSIHSYHVLQIGISKSSSKSPASHLSACIILLCD